MGKIRRKQQTKPVSGIGGRKLLETQKEYNDVSDRERAEKIISKVIQRYLYRESSFCERWKSQWKDLKCMIVRREKWEKIIPYVLQTQEWGLSATEGRRNKSQNLGGKSRKVNADFGN